MKKLLFIAICLLCSIAAMAQSDRKVIYTVPFFPENEVRFSIGFVPLSIGTRNIDKNYYPNIMSDGASLERILKTPAINLAYSYRVERWFEVGLTLSYNGAYSDGYTTMNNKLGMWHSNVTDICIVPTFRFVWYRSKYVRLYSSVGVGVALSINDENNGFSNYNSLGYGFAGQMTLLGVSAGNKVFGFAEMGSVGSAGMAVFGVGYRFIDGF